MSDLTTEQVVITRESADVGKPGRVFVTGPHFGGTSVFSSTKYPQRAALYPRSRAEHYLAQGKWRHLDPRIEAAG